MRPYFSYAITLGLLHFNTPVLKAQAEEPETVVEKVLPDKRRIVVVRKEVPDVPPPPVYEGTGESRVLLTRVKPDRTSEFSLFLVASDKKFRRLTWKKTIPEYLKYEPEVKFFDVFFDKETLVVVYNAEDMYKAEVSTPELPYEKEDLDFSRIFYQRKIDQGPFVASATVQRWGRSKILSLAVRFSNKATARYLWTPEAKAGESKWLMISKPPSLDPSAPEAAGPALIVPQKQRRQFGPAK